MSATIGGVDASIPLQAGRGVAAPPDPLATIEKFALTKNLLNQNALFPGQQALQQQAVQGGAVSLAQHINQATAGAVTPLLAKEVGTITHADVTNQLAIAETNGIPTGNLTAALARFPNGDGPEFDQNFRAWTLSQAQPTPTAAATVLPGQAQISTGLAVQPGTVGAPGLPGQGAFTRAGTPIDQYPSRGELAGRVPVGFDPKTGAPIFGPLANVTPPALSGLPTQSPFGTGRLPAALLNPGNPANNGNVVTAPGPGQQAALAGTGASSAQGFQAIADRGNQAVQQNAILSNMQNDLNQFSSGTGVNKTLDFKRAIVSWAPQLATALGVDPKAVAANESFDKLAAQIADAQGAGSDHRLDVTQAANPHAGLSPQGANLIIRQLQGNADYLRAVQQLAAKQPDKSDYQGFTANVSRTLDPRFFQLNRMTPEQQKDYLTAMPRDQNAAFKQAYIAAKQQGLLNVGQ